MESVIDILLEDSDGVDDLLADEFDYDYASEFCDDIEDTELEIAYGDDEDDIILGMMGISLEDFDEDDIDE